MRSKKVVPLKKKAPVKNADETCSHMVVSMMGQPQQLKVISEISKAIANSQCNVCEFRASTLGEHINAYFLLEGKWNQLAKAETLLNKLAQAQKWFLQMQRTAFVPPTETKAIPYTIYVVGLDDAKKTYEIISFFTSQSMTLLEVHQHTYQAKYTGSRMMSLTMQISIPMDLHIADLRDRFMTFADELNVDAIMEPGK